MMDKEEYKKEIVRMWDSIRDKHKGEYSCYGVDCDSCPLGRKCDRILKQWKNGARTTHKKSTKFLN